MPSSSHQENTPPALPPRPTFETLFRRTVVSQSAFARQAGVDYTVVRKARTGQPIAELSARKVLNTLNALLNTQYQLEDIDWQYGGNSSDE